jgi:Adenine-specific methyltransferase EcoRI
LIYQFFQTYFWLVILGQGEVIVAQKILQIAKHQKNDEFYTQLVDIENELKHYKEQFRGKVVFCNCDDPYESNFFKYFANNFNYLGLKKLITTSYTRSPIAGTQLPLFEMEGLKPDGKQPFKVEINVVPDSDHDGAVNLSDVQYLLKHDKNTATPLEGNGDFRSEECVELLQEADIVCTNPPFSLFREYVAQLVEHNKKFLIIGNKNAITYLDVFIPTCAPCDIIRETMKEGENLLWERESHEPQRIIQLKKSNVA